MQKLKFRADFGAGFIPIPVAMNYKGMKLQLLFTKDAMQQQLQSITFEWAKASAKFLNTHRKNGLTGGLGVYEGPGLQIDAGNLPLQIFDGCLDTADPSTEWSNDIVKCRIKDSGTNDWIYSYGKSITFQYLTTPDYSSSSDFILAAQITRADYKQTPYCISTIPDYQSAAMLSITLFIMVKESVDVVCKIASLITRCISQSLSWLQLIGTIIEIVLYLIYLIAIIIQSAKLMQELFDNLVQPKKTKLCMREVDLWKKMCAYFGLTYVSSIHCEGGAYGYGGKYINATYMPSKIVIPNGDPALLDFKRPQDESTNPNSYGYFEGTPADWIAYQEMVYNARHIVKNGCMYFEEIHKPDVLNPYILPNEGVVGNTFLYPEPYNTNASEIPISYQLRFLKDDQEINTYNDYSGTFACAITKPNIVHNKKNILFNNAQNITLPVALARRKLGFTNLEKALINSFNQFSSFISDVGARVAHLNGQLNAISPAALTGANPGSDTEVGIMVGFLTGQPVYSVITMVLGADGIPIFPSEPTYTIASERIGWMLLSNDFIGVPKRFIGTQNGPDWYIDPNNQITQATSLLPSTGLNGSFTGSGAGGGIVGQVVTGTVVAGILTCTSITVGAGPTTLIITGTIAGLSGTFTSYVTASQAAGVMHGTGAITGSTSVTITHEGNGGALSLMNDFHSMNLMDNNQYLLYKNKRIKFSIKDWIALTNNNVIKTSDGRFGKMDKILWDIHNDYADIDYRIHEKFTNNYNITISTDGG